VAGCASRSTTALLNNELGEFPGCLLGSPVLGYAHPISGVAAPADAIHASHVRPSGWRAEALPMASERAKKNSAKTAEQPDPKAAAQPEPFRLVSIERTEPPTGAAGKNWHRYTIRQGANAINGYLQGTSAAVKHAAEQIVNQLNERRAGRWGYRTTRAAAPAPGG